MLDDRSPFSLPGLLAMVFSCIAVQESLIWAYRAWRGGSGRRRPL